MTSRLAAALALVLVAGLGASADDRAPPKGAVLAIGGGTIGDEVIDRFLALAGAGPIAVCPAASGRVEGPEAARLRARGAKAVEVIAPRLRRSDMIAIYKRRVALLLPRMSPDAIAALTQRIWPTFDAAVGTKVVERVPAIVFPGPDPNTGLSLDGTQAVLDWLEDQLRSDLAT